METLTKTQFRPGPQSPVILAVDRAVAGSYERIYCLCRGESMLCQVTAHDFSAAAEETVPEGQVFVVLYPTRTSVQGFGGHLFSDISPEDRAMIRAVRQRYPGRTVCLKVPLHDTSFFEDREGFLNGEEEKKQYHHEREAAVAFHDEDKGHIHSPACIEFDAKFLANMKAIFMSCLTTPNRQDYLYLVTKTFGLNLAVRLAFAGKAVMKGELALYRAILSTSWYQLQDAVFTVFGQTYMKFLGKMTGMVRIHKTHAGDFVFVYIQLCGFEFINRLVLGPLGENPLVYTPVGIGLIFLNILQGMISGGPLIPAINQMRKVGVISHNTMMHFYQLSSLTMQFGLFATFGYQTFYTILTASILLISWSSYFVFSTLYKDPEFVRLCDKAAMATMDGLARRATSSPA